MTSSVASPVVRSPEAREAIAKFLEDEHLRTQGWYTAINSITAILDTSRMGYQHIHNFKNARHLQVREYQDTD